jgi:hypothetical protein
VAGVVVSHRRRRGRAGWSGTPSGDEDHEIAQGLAGTVPGAELFVYPGTEHYFAEHGEHAAAQLQERVLGFLG